MPEAVAGARPPSMGLGDEIAPALEEVRSSRSFNLIASRAVVMHHKTQRPVQFEITPTTRDAVQRWIKTAGVKSDDLLFPSRMHGSRSHLGTRQYARTSAPPWPVGRTSGSSVRAQNEG